MINLRGKNCVITGATGALGSSLARYLNFEECNLFLTGSNEEKLDGVSNGLDQSYGWVHHFPANLTSLNEINNLCGEIDGVFDKVDILVNSAGVFAIKDIEDVTLLDLDRFLEVNVKAPYYLSQYFSKGMKTNGWGKIINVGSSSSYNGFKRGSLYCMTKHAILGMSRALFEELKEYNVEVLCVSPGSMQSEMGRISVDQDFSTFLKPEDVARQIITLLEMDNNMICKELRLDRMVMR